MGELLGVLDERAEWPDSTGVRSTIEFRALVARSERSSVFEKSGTGSCPIPSPASNLFIINNLGCIFVQVFHLVLTYSANPHQEIRDIQGCFREGSPSGISSKAEPIFVRGLAGRTITLERTAETA